MTVDGGYTGPAAERACDDQQVELRPTRLCEGKSRGDQWSREAYTWEVDAKGRPVCVTCPEGQTAEVRRGRKPSRYLARFDRERCADCPSFQRQCQVQERKRVPPTLYVTQRAVTVAQQRQRLRPEDRSIRAVMEASVRSLKQSLRGDKLPVRGLTRAQMFLFGAVMMVNLRGVHGYESEKPQKSGEMAASILLRPLKAIFVWIQHNRATSKPLLSHRSLPTLNISQA